jgi:hypothetical protein
MQNTTRSSHLSSAELSQLVSPSSTLSSCRTRTDWISNQEVKACCSLRPIAPPEDVVVLSGDVVVMACLLEEETLVAEAEVTPSRRGTSSHCVNSVEELTTRLSSAIRF